jgi:hypothetical protein
MDVRIARVLVRQNLTAMQMQMRFVATPGERVLVMFVVTVPVRVLERLVRVLVQMSFAQVQPDP